MNGRISAHRRPLPSVAGALISVVCVLCSSSIAIAGEPYSLIYRGKVSLSTDSVIDQNQATFKIAGMSGIAPTGDSAVDYVAVMDNSNHLVFLKVTFKGDGSIDQVAATSGLTIGDSRDYEGIAYNNVNRNSVFLSNEATPPPPALYEYDLATGKLLQTIKLPPVFAHQVDNRGLESLTRRPNGTEMWTANEEALTVDGPVSSATTGSIVRLVRLVVEGNTVTPVQQYAYEVAPIHTGIGKPVASGLSDMVVLPDGTLLTLERSALEGLPVFQTRIYQVDFGGATDISKGALAEGLKGKSYVPVKKILLLESSKIGENLEGLCLGPKLANGNRTLLGVVDGNNGSGGGDPISKNTLVAFELVEPAQPFSMTPTIAAAVGGASLLFVALVTLILRRRKTVS